MTMMLRPDKQRHDKPKRNKVVLKRRRVPVLDEVVDEFPVPAIQLLLLHAKADSCTIDDRQVASHVLYIIDATDAIVI